MILCGGSGERLWPASRPWRPKPFLRLVGEHSTFQAAAIRAQGLGPLVVVGGAAHEGLISEQLAALSIEATVLLEPVGRNTAAAIAAAAAWVAVREPEAIVAVLAADHHIPDGAAFRAALAETFAAAEDGRIVTLGLRPTSASEALGYIQPGEGQGAVRPIAAFDEKPDAEGAMALVAAGALWNSGTFVGRAATLAAEIERWAPEVAVAATAALDGAETRNGAVWLGAAFADAPRIGFDHAVMERTDRGAVLPAAFAWSDLGAWDAVFAAGAVDGEGNLLEGAASAPGSRQVLVRAGAGVQVAVVGASRLAVVAEPDAVLVCDLDHAQPVRDVAVGGAARFASLPEAAEWLDAWLRTAALPLWATVGVDPTTGAFREALTLDGRPDDPRRRARVQARQAFVFASAEAEGLPGGWRAVAERGFDWFAAYGRGADGLFATTLDLAGAPTTPEPHLYEHAFILLALAALGREGDALAVLGRLQAFRHPMGGFREAGDQPFQANAHMHLLEAAIAWADAGGDPAWSVLADEITALALERFVDPTTGALHEFFDADWRPLAGDAGAVEPGHLFEWAWLLAQRPTPERRAAARRLFAAGRRGVDARGVVVNTLHADLSVRDGGARLWPQTEYLKAALAMGDEAAALEAANTIGSFLETPVRGVWRERKAAHGGFVAQSSPATSLYHLYVAIRELTRFADEAC